MAQEVEKCCRESLEKIERSGISRQGIVFLAVRSALKRYDHFSPEIRKGFENRRDSANKLIRQLENVARRSTVFPILASALQREALRWRGYNKGLGNYLRKHGRKDHDQAIPLIVSTILEYKQEFDAWDAVRDVIEMAYDTAGRRTTADFDKLIRRAVADWRLTRPDSPNGAVAQNPHKH